MIDNWEEKPKKKIKNNDTLLISEIQNKVILPYTAEEIEEILKKESTNCLSEEEVIQSSFTKPLSDYKFQFWSRYNETVKLLTQRDNYRMIDAIALGLEMLPKKYLYPAIITACRNLDELNVYLDCLEKNELDDFRIFNIKYEIYPLVIKQNNEIYIKKNFIMKAIDFIKNIFKNKRKIGREETVKINDAKSDNRYF